VAPGGSPSNIEMSVVGAQSVSIDAAGNLDITTPGGTLVDAPPAIFQDVNGVQTQVSGGFVLEGTNLVGFQIGSYNASLSLTIDPTLTFSTYLGGSGTDVGNGITVDAAGNSYIVGSTTSSNFPGASGTYAGNQDAFVVRLDPDGNRIYSTYLGGSSTDAGNAIAIDAAGNAYVTGSTNSTNFPTVNAYQSFKNGNPNVTNVFVTKLNATGGIIYSTYLGGNNNDAGNGIAVDATGAAYVTGSTTSGGLMMGHFPTTSGAYQTSYGGSGDGFVTKFSPAGNTLVYSTYLGGSGADQGNGIAIDAAGNAYVTGSTQSSNFPTASAYQSSLRGTWPARRMPSSRSSQRPAVRWRTPLTWAATAPIPGAASAWTATTWLP
jgi:hypothetical protein